MMLPRKAWPERSQTVRAEVVLENVCCSLKIELFVWI